ncbi:hypothetical protein HDV00_009298 [Rhizophlyctis rosea]|nr:hypothetical protein HDV00_009298 [Rhizophlyctis rosea]
MSCVKTNKGWDKSGQLCSLCLSAVSLGDLTVDEELKRTVDDLDVYCVRKRKGCEWVGPRKYLFVHVAEECIFAPVSSEPNPETMSYLSAVEDPTRSVAINATYPVVSETLGRPLPPRVDSTPKLGTDISVGLWTDDMGRPLNTEHRFKGHIVVPPRSASAEPVQKTPRRVVLASGMEVPRRTAVPRVGEGGDLTLSDGEARAMARRRGADMNVVDDPIEIITEAEKWQSYPVRLDEEEVAFALGGSSVDSTPSTPRSLRSLGYGIPRESLEHEQGKRWSELTTDGQVGRATQDGISLMGDVSLYSRDSDAVTEIDEEEWRGTINGWRPHARSNVTDL